MEKVLSGNRRIGKALIFLIILIIFAFSLFVNVDEVHAAVVPGVIGAFSATVPTSLPVSVASDGTVTTATDFTITSNQPNGALNLGIELSSITITPSNNWVLTEYEDDYSNKPIGTKEFAVRINGKNVGIDGAMPGPLLILDIGESYTFSYDVKIPIQINAVSESIAEVVFVINGSKIDNSSYYEITDGVLTGLTETGEVRLNSSGELIIPSTVTEIAANAFSNNSNITSLTIPASVTKIGTNAFSECINLTEITFEHAAEDTLVIEDGSFSASDYVSTKVTASHSAALNYDWIGDMRPEKAPGLYQDGELVIPWATLVSDGTIHVSNGEVTTNATYNSSEGAWTNSSSETLKGNLVFPSDGRVTSFGNSAFENCSGLTGDLIIPEGVTSIGNYAFENCSGLTGTLKIPDGITSIREYAFAGCSGFSGTLTIPNSVTSIGYGAFYGCSGFTGDFTIPEGITSINSFAFNGCSGFTGSLIIPNSVTNIGSSAFSGCSGFTGSLIIPNSVTNIGSSAFSGCSGFTGDLTIPEGVTSIGYAAFNECSGFTGDLTIPEGVTNIGNRAFYNCSGLTGKLIIPEGVTTIGYAAFYNCSGFTGNLTIPEGVTSIGNETFYNCSGFTGNLTIPEGVTTIGNWAFYGCSGLTENLTIPEGVTSIGNYAFENCSGLTGTLTIPEGVTSIGKYAFIGCTNLSKIILPSSLITIGTVAFPIPSSGYWYNIETGEAYTASELPTETAATYVASKELLPVFTNDGVGTITGLTTYGKTLAKLKIPSTIDGVAITAIGDSAFINNITVTSITIPNGITTIGGKAFEGCSNLTGKLSIPESVSIIGFRAFYGCSNLTGDLVIPEGVTTIGTNTFAGCSGFNGELSLPASLTTINNGAFDGCSGLTGNLIIPESVTSIGQYSFEGCSGFTGALIIPENVDSIGIMAFYGCKNLGDLTISEGVTSIDAYAFSGCTNINKITLPASLITIGLSPFPPSSSGYWYNIETGEAYTESTIPTETAATYVASQELLPIYTVTFHPNRGIGSMESQTILIGKATNLSANAFTREGYNFIGWATSSVGDVVYTDSQAVTDIGVNGSTVNLYAIWEGNGSAGLYDSNKFTPWNTLISDGVIHVTDGVVTTNYGATSSFTNDSTSVISGDLILPKDGSITALGDDAFNSCYNLRGIELPNSITTIGKRAFQSCNLQSINIPDNVETINESAFDSNSSLTNVYIPSSVTFIGVNAFDHCYNMTDITVSSENENYASENGVLFNKSKTTLIKYPNGKTEETYTIPVGVTRVDNFAFSWSQLTNVEFSNSVESIGQYAFRLCDKITSITMPDNISSIEQYAFFNCSGLTSVTFNGTPTTISSTVFEYSDNLSDIYVPWSEDEVANAPWGATNATVHYLVPAGLYQNDVMVASWDELLADEVIYVNDGVLTSNADANAQTNTSANTLIGNLVIDNSVTSIGDSAFRYCSSLTNITIPDGVTSIEWGAFDDCSSLISITIPDSVTSIGNCAFRGCSSLTNITIPDGIVSIGSETFKKCSKLTNITIPDSVTSIGYSAFMSCYNLTDVYYTGSETEWNKISINASYNNSLTYATMHYNSTMPETECFPEDSVVLTTTDGAVKEISLFESGDLVVAYNNEIDCDFITEVESLIARKNTTDMVDIIFEDGTVLSMTVEHPVYTENGFRSVTNYNGEGELQVGDKVKAEDGYLEITNITTYEVDPFTTYNLSIYTDDENLEGIIYVNGIATLCQTVYKPVCKCGTETDIHLEDCPLYVVPACTCKALEGELHIEGCPLYELPECSCNTETELHDENCPCYTKPECTCDTENDIHNETCALYKAPVCTCECVDGVHTEECKMYVIPEDTCICEAEDGIHKEECPLYEAPAPVCSYGCIEGIHLEGCELYEEVTTEPAITTDVAITSSAITGGAITTGPEVDITETGVTDSAITSGSAVTTTESAVTGPVANEDQEKGDGADGNIGTENAGEDNAVSPPSVESPDLNIDFGNSEPSDQNSNNTGDEDNASNNGEIIDALPPDETVNNSESGNTEEIKENEGEEPEILKEDSGSENEGENEAEQ